MNGIGLMKKFGEDSTFMKHHVIPPISRFVTLSLEIDFDTTDYICAFGSSLLLLAGTLFALVSKTKKARRWVIVGACVIATLFYIVSLWRVSQIMDEIAQYTGFPHYFPGEDNLSFWFLSFLASVSYCATLTFLDVTKMHIEEGAEPDRKELQLC
jgi:uncharacterized membrane protein YozB (DUF420 family)